MMWRQYLNAAMRDPTALPRYIVGGTEGLLKREFVRLVGRYPTDLREEFRSKSNPLSVVFSEMQQLPYLGWIGGVEILYLIVRSVRPSIVVETGVAAGLSSACILAALERNGAGELYSVDRPEYEKSYLPTLGLHPTALLPDGKQTGFLVPETLRTRWHLYLGDTREMLPKLISNLGKVGIFLHDSEHTYEAMTFEYETIFPSLSSKGILLSDNVNWNDAFPDFCRRHHLKPVYFWRTGMAATVKTTDLINGTRQLLE